MKLEMYSFYRKDIKATGQILFDDHEPRVAQKQMERACLQMPLAELKEKRSLQKFIYLGSYDDETMKFEPSDDPEILVDFDKIIDQREVFESSVKKEISAKSGS